MLCELFHIPFIYRNSCTLSLSTSTRTCRAATIVLKENNCHLMRVDKEHFNRILRDVEANTLRLQEHNKDVLVLERVAKQRGHSSAFKYVFVFLCECSLIMFPVSNDELWVCFSFLVINKFALIGLQLFNAPDELKFAKISHHKKVDDTKICVSLLLFLNSLYTKSKTKHFIMG